jgi:hypothetical protein
MAETGGVEIFIGKHVWALAVLSLWAPLAMADDWREVFTDRFDAAASLKQWSLEGSAEVTIADGRLHVANKKARIEGQSCQESTLWCRQPFWGDLRLEMDCRAEPKSRCLVFFCARTNPPEGDIFAWKRPLARYADYAYEPRLELYSLGLLRSDQAELNLRHLGGRVPEEWLRVLAFPPQRFPARYLTPEEMKSALASIGAAKMPADPEEVAKLTRTGMFCELLAPHLTRYEKVNAEFQEASIIARHHADPPAFSDASKTYHIVITVIGNRVTYEVDGRAIIEHTDAPRAAAPLRGGYLALRNFAPTIVWYDNLRVWIKP